MEVYVSSLFFLTSSFLAIVSSKSALSLVDESDNDIVAGIALKVRIKNKNLRNDVHMSLETLLDVEDLHKIVNIVLNSPYYTNGEDNVEAVQNEADPINKVHISIQSTNVDQEDVLVRNPLNNSLPALEEFSDEELADFLKNEPIEPFNVIPVLKGTNSLLPTRPSPEQKMREDKAENLHGLTSSIFRTNESNRTDSIRDNDIADKIDGGYELLHKLELVKKIPIGKKQLGGFGMVQKINDSDTLNGAENLSVVTHEDENRANADFWPTEKTDTMLLKTEQKGDDQSSESDTVNKGPTLSDKSEKILSDERQPGYTMKQLIDAINVVIPSPAKYPALKMKLKSTGISTIAAKGKPEEPSH